jgi:hypothetical protein
MAAPGAAPRRAVTQRDVDVLLKYVALLRLPPTERRAACDDLLDHLAAHEGPLPLSTCIFIAAHGCAEHAFDVIGAALDHRREIKPDNHEAFGMARAQSALQLFVRVPGEPIWKHPRFPALCARLGLAQYWLDTMKWPDCADEVDYDFRAACADAVGESRN